MIQEALVARVIKTGATELTGYVIHTYRLEAKDKLSDPQIKAAHVSFMGNGKLTILKRAAQRNEYGFFSYECESVTGR